MNCHSITQLLATPAVLSLTLLALLPPADIPTAEAGPPAARSATRYSDAPQNDEATVAPTLLRRGLAVSDAGVEGGTDVTLSTTNGRNEPAVAVNPSNPSNIIVAKLFGLRVSTDGGVTFGPEIASPVPSTHERCGDPSLAFDSQSRLFWTYLGCVGADEARIDVFAARVNPATGAVIGAAVNATAAAGVPGSAPNGNDKPWMAVDRWAGSPFQDRIYLVWSNFLPAGVFLQTSLSTDQGATWSPAVTRSVAAEGFPWPSHNAVAANGDVYIAYHAQPRFAANNPDGASGRIIILRSADGGATYTKTTAFTGGNADITFNNRTPPATRLLNQNQSWTQGAAQPWVLPDPRSTNNVFVVAADDPTNAAHGGANDDMNVYIARSTDQGATWSAPIRVDHGPDGSHAFFPTASIDDHTGCIVVNWYDSRRALTNAGGNFLLDVFQTISNDGGLTFDAETRINDTAFDPDLGATDRFPPTGTLRIGEYIGVALANGVAHSVWTGNTATGQQIVYESSVTNCTNPPVAQCKNVTVTADPALCTAPASIDDGSFDPDGGPISLTQVPPSPYGVGATNVTLTVTDDHGASDSCTATVTVVDITPPVISSIAATPNLLWPPNHKLVPVTVAASVADACDATPVCQILSVSSNEPVDGLGDGDTSPDWNITGPLAVALRAERSGTGSGRVYTLTVRCADASGNASTGTVAVAVPHSRGR